MGTSGYQPSGCGSICRPLPGIEPSRRLGSRPFGGHGVKRSAVRDQADVPVSIHGTSRRSCSHSATAASKSSVPSSRLPVPVGYRTTRVRSICRYVILDLQRSCARWRGGVVGRTRAAHLAPGAHASHEADEVQDVSQGDPGSDFGKVKARLGGSSQGRATRGRSLSEMRGWVHIGGEKEKRNPYQSPRG